MHAKGLRPVAKNQRFSGIDRSQQVLGGVLWLGLTTLLIYISS